MAFSAGPKVFSEDEKDPNTRNCVRISLRTVLGWLDRYDKVSWRSRLRRNPMAAGDTTRRLVRLIRVDTTSRLLVSDEEEIS